MNIYELRKKLGRLEVLGRDLTIALKDYAQPRNKISRFIKSGELLHIKKNLYLINPDLFEDLYSKELLSSWAYGPSAISLHYALYYYGIIPETVYEITCITPKRNNLYKTPIGIFSYKHLSLTKYMVGLTTIEVLKDVLVYMATPEKAICDLLYLATERLNDVNELEEHILDNMRMNENILENLNKELINEIADCYKNFNVNLFRNWISYKYE